MNKSTKRVFNADEAATITYSFYSMYEGAADSIVEMACIAIEAAAKAGKNQVDFTVPQGVTGKVEYEHNFMIDMVLKRLRGLRYEASPVMGSIGTIQIKWKVSQSSSAKTLFEKKAKEKEKQEQERIREMARLLSRQNNRRAYKDDIVQYEKPGYSSGKAYSSFISSKSRGFKNRF